jgi:RNA polymerase sigma-70 factor (ECF subfamily)
MTSEFDEFRRIFDACYPRLTAYARRRVDVSTADDVVADTFLVAWRRRAEFLAIDHQLPWLYTVAANQLRNQQRSSDRHLRLVAKAGGEPAEPTAGADAGIAVEPDVERLRQALETLSFDDQEVLRLITWEELSYAETAAALECSTDAVAQRLRRARQRLAKALAEVDGNHAATRSPSDPTDLPIAEVQ